MRTLLFILVLLCAGCGNIVGPFERAQVKSARQLHDGGIAVDDPRLTIAEQEALGRQYLALPDESRAAGPLSGTARPITEVGR